MHQRFSIRKGGRTLAAARTCAEWALCAELQVRQVAEEAIARARRGEGPTLIEAETYRFRGHSLADPDELRTKEEKDFYLVRPHLASVQGLILS